MAHEYAHVAEEHLGPQYVYRATPAGDLAVLAESRDNEYEADLVALRFLLADADWSDGGDGLDDANYRIAGIALFLGIGCYIDFYRTGTFEPDRNPLATHPASMKRLIRLLEHIDSRYGPEITILARTWFDVFVKNGRRVLHEFRTMQEAFKNSGRKTLPWEQTDAPGCGSTT